MMATQIRTGPLRIFLSAPVESLTVVYITSGRMKVTMMPPAVEPKPRPAAISSRCLTTGVETEAKEPYGAEVAE